jgi:tRNA A-37 threonylcarbamoyl transferase component Bud32
MVYNRRVSGESFNKRSPETLERSIQNAIEQLPDPLQRRWAERLNNAPDDELKALDDELRAFVEKRESVLRRAPASLGDFKHSDKDEARIQTTLERIREAAERPDLYVGEGKSAEVFRDTMESDRCYKIVTNFKEYATWNSIGTEAHFLEELEDLVVDGVRTPRVSSVIDRPEIKAISMEYIDGENVKILIEKNKPLPGNFDLKRFMTKLRAYVKAMHDRNIYHRDLHGGNVLVGRDGNPYVIDFGQATVSFSPDYAYEAYDRTGQNRIMLTSDEAHVDGIEAALRAHQAKAQAKTSR